MKTLKKRKKVQYMEKPFTKDNFNYDAQIETYIRPLGENIISKKNIRI